MPYTSIRISTETKNKLDSLKVHKKDSYDESLQKIFSLILNQETDKKEGGNNADIQSDRVEQRTDTQ